MQTAFSGPQSSQHLRVGGQLMWPHHCRRASRAAGMGEAAAMLATQQATRRYADFMLIQ